MKFKSLYLALAAGLFFTGASKASFIPVFDVFAEPNFGVPGGTITESGLANATDGNLATGYLVTVSPGTVNQSQGLRVRWDFDVSAYTSITSFEFNFDGILNDPSSLDNLRIGASPFSNFLTLATADGVQVGTTLTLTPGAMSGFNDLNNYVFGGLLSVYIQTGFGTGLASLGSTELTTLEVSGDIDGELAVVPVPAAIWLFGTALMGFVGMSRRRKVA